MARSYFSLEDGHPLGDPLGEDLADDEAAIEAARQIAADLARHNRNPATSASWSEIARIGTWAKLH
jgi:hypothetical protein